MLYFLVTRLKELFQNWNLLNDDERQFIDVQVEKWNSPGHKQLYKTVKQALIRWGKVQDTEGIYHFGKHPLYLAKSRQK